MMIALLMLLQSTDVRVEGTIPLWGLIMFAAMCGATAIRVLIHSKYHKEHYAHKDDRKMHPDPQIEEGKRALLEQSQINLNNTLVAHLESDMKASERGERVIEEMRKENRDNSEKLQRLLEESRKQAQEHTEKMVKAVVEAARR
jgi:hypothetical protein